jgi:hypothetical protein
MIETTLKVEPKEPKQPPRPLRVSIPLKATNCTGKGVKDFEGRLEAIDEGRAQIFLDHPLAEGTKLDVVVEFRDRRNREIRFRYEAKVASAVSRQWYEMAVTFGEGVGISGKDAREMLADLFPEEAPESSPQQPSKTWRRTGPNRRPMRSGKDQ